jgi:hypothetical protein
LEGDKVSKLNRDKVFYEAKIENVPVDVLAKKYSVTRKSIYQILQGFDKDDKVRILKVEIERLKAMNEKLNVHSLLRTEIEKLKRVIDDIWVNKGEKRLQPDTKPNRNGDREGDTDVPSIKDIFANRNGNGIKRATDEDCGGIFE